MHAANSSLAHKRARSTHRAARMMAKNGLTITAEQKALVVAEVKKYVDKANQLYGYRMTKPCSYPQVLFNKTGRVAGTANYALAQVDFNPALLVKEWDDMIADTVPHEVAHIVTRHVYGSGPEAHGPEWRSVMHDFGIKEVKRTHSYDVTGIKRQVARYEYFCGCEKPHHVVAKQRNKLLRGARYKCRKCGLFLVEKRGDPQPLKPRPIAPPPTPFVVPTAPGMSARINFGHPVTPAPMLRPAALTGSKLDKCRALFRFNGAWERKEVIALFVSDAGCTAAGAATYYATIKKEFGM